MIKYVLLVVTDPSKKKVVGLIKDRGPEELIGKRTFPGGKIEQGEDLFEAATREMREETGILVDGWKLASTVHKAMDEEPYTLYTLCAVSDQVEKASTQESEQVLIYSVDQELALMAEEPEAYAPDFDSKIKTIKIA